MPNGPLWKYTVRCKHVHLSGRRCAERIPKKTSATRVFCGLHKAVCKDCVSMATAFGLDPRKVIDGRL